MGSPHHHMELSTLSIMQSTFILLLLCLCISSKHEHGKPLSDKEHDDSNHEYDHEAFLGDEAKEFDELTPEESKRRLGMIVDRVDVDNNKVISIEELEKWIQDAQARHWQKTLLEEWKNYKPKEKDALTWDEYIKENYDDSYGISEENQKDRDRAHLKWLAADTDKDGKLTITEFKSFQHPEDVEHMKPLVVQETLEDVDKDGDGFISLAEYLSDMVGEQEESKEEPEWVTEEKEYFVKLDKNSDGKLDAAEVKEWIMPADDEHAREEAKHLITEADSNKDNKLTKEEILEKYDVFVGSQATEWGDALQRHDEF